MLLPILHINLERWKKNEEYGVYVSTLGRIRLIKNKEYLSPRIEPGGYCTVFTEKGLQYVHRLVAYTWLGGKRNEKYNVDHIDNNKRNNAISNLRWVEQGINTEYASFTRTTISPPTGIHTIERTEQLISRVRDEQLSNDARGKALLELFNRGDAQIIYNNVEVKTMLGFNNLKATCGAGESADYHFAGRIVRAFVSDTPYCKYNWIIKFKE